MGQGSDTAYALIVGEVLGIDAEEVRVIHSDTDITPYDMGTLGSRSLYHMGNAMRLAAEDARNKLRALAIEAGLPEGTNYPPSEIFKKRFGMQAGNVIGSASFVPSYKPPDAQTGQSDNVTPFWMVGGAGVEVEVDTETGHVRIVRLVNAVDCGKPINAGVVGAQISGAAIMQLGFTLSEAMHLDGGQVTNASLADYKIPGIGDIPPMESEYVAAEQHTGPFGAKGVGESGPSAYRRPLPTRSTTPSASASWNCRSQPKRCCAPCAPKKAARWRTNDECTHHQFHAQRRRGFDHDRAASQPRRTAAAPSTCSARAKAAARACAAAAPWWSTARPFPAASISVSGSTAKR